MTRSKPKRSRHPLLTAPLRRALPRHPFRDWDLSIKRIILLALQAAWEQISREVAQDGGSLLAESEPMLTSRLEKALNEIQTDPSHPSGFSGSVFQTVVRDGSSVNFDYKILEKRPDLTFRLVSTEPGIDRYFFGLFAECKLIGPDHPVRLYCEKGIFRFVCGDYAWGMPSGLMVGYARPGFTIPEHLIPSLHAKKGGKHDLSICFNPRVASDLSGPLDVYESAHGRPWTFPETGQSPGDISILHLWLPFPPSTP